MIHIVCWKWKHPSYRTVYTSEHVNVLYSMFRRHLHRPFRLVCVTDDADGIECETYPLWDDHRGLMNPNGFNLPCCYTRLKLFSRDVTQNMGIALGEQVVSIDLDVILTNTIGELFTRAEDFIAWKGIGAYQPYVYNGSLWMFRTGKWDWIWEKFDPIRSPQQTRDQRYFGSDQGWISLNLATKDSPGWGDADGVLSYSRDVRGRQLPPSAKLVFFNGKHKPWDEVTLRQSPWVQSHWR